MKIVFDADDFSILRSRMDLLLKIKEHYPKFKISLFTIPYDYEYETSRLRLFRDEALKSIHENLDWMKIIPHGLLHLPREFEKCDKKTMEMTLKGIDETFKKDGLPYVKGFKAPQWLWNQDVVDVLDDNGWFGAIDRNQPEMLKTKKYYEYNYSIEEPFWHAKEDLLKLHAHMTLPSTNNLEDCLLNIMKMPLDSEFYFVTDFIEGFNDPNSKEHWDRVYGEEGETDPNYRNDKISFDKILSEVKGSILDIGCGNGYLLSRASELGLTDLNGFDLSTSGIEVAKKRVKAKFKSGNAESLPYKNNEFDTTVTTEFLEHITEIEKVVAEIARVTKYQSLHITPYGNEVPSNEHVQIFDESIKDLFKKYFKNVEVEVFLHPNRMYGDNINWKYSRMLFIKATK